MRHRDEPLDVGAELADGGARYHVERVEPPPNPNAFGHAWASAPAQLDLVGLKARPWGAKT
jgi:hypothetical protein